jgi:hypothetical protein
MPVRDDTACRLGNALLTQHTPRRATQPTQTLEEEAAAQMCWCEAVDELQRLRLSDEGARLSSGGGAAAAKMRTLEDLLTARGHMGG